jgi:hypothetical protein
MNHFLSHGKNTGGIAEAIEEDDEISSEEDLCEVNPLDV